jgi:sugar phosphate isomerase/epimerase
LDHWFEAAGLFKYAITLASFKDIEPMDKTLKNISALMYDAAEMYGEPDKCNARELSEMFSSYGMPVCGITGMWGVISEDGWKRKLLSQDAGIQKHAKDYVRKCVEMCASLGGRHLNLCLFADDANLSFFERTHRTVAQERKNGMQELAIPVLSELATFASEHGVKLLIEPLNRYSTPYCSTASDALAIAEKVHSDSLGVMLDTFHMNIEEDSFQDSIADSATLLGHMHFADNNRKMPGYGHIDFRAVVDALKRARYCSYISFEPTIHGSGYGEPLNKGLSYIRELERN